MKKEKRVMKAGAAGLECLCLTDIVTA